MTAEKPKRPLSPHLQVYKPQMTSMLSILHRATGAALAIGVLFVAWWLIAAATGPEAYETVQNFSGSILGKLVLVGWSFSLVFHTLNGVRHLIWDTGRMMNISCATKAGYMVFWGAVILTGVLWSIAYQTPSADHASNAECLAECADYPQDEIEDCAERACGEKRGEEE